MNVRVVIPLFVLAILSAACGATALAAQPQGVVAATRTPKPTKETTATPDVAGTLAVAHAHETAANETANAAELQVAAITAEANRISAAGTADSMNMTQQAAAIAAQAEADKMLMLSWTATAAATSIPLTATARAEDNARTKQLIAVSSGMLTATYQAPTQVVAMALAQQRRAEAEASAKAAPMNESARTFAWFGLGLLGMSMAALFIFVIYRGVIEARQKDEEEARKAEAEVKPAPVIKTNFGTPLVVKNSDTAFVTARYLNVPCSADELQRLAHGVIMEHKSLAINVWEVSESRGGIGKRIFQVRAFFQSNRFVKSRGGGQVDLTPMGEAFLEAFLREGHLPTGMAFIAEDPESPVIMAMPYGHGDENDGGGQVADGFQPIGGTE